MLTHRRDVARGPEAPYSAALSSFKPEVLFEAVPVTVRIGLFLEYG